jgi:hypothetical protein
MKIRLRSNCDNRKLGMEFFKNPTFRSLLVYLWKWELVLGF